MALSIGFRIFSFLPSCYSSYGALNFYPGGTFTHCSCQPSLDAHFSGKNLTPYGGLLPVITMLEKLGFQTLVEETVTSKRIPRAMDLYRFVLGIVLSLYIGFPRLNQLRFIARDPILTGILKVTRLPVQSTFWRFVNTLHGNVARQMLSIMRTMRERVWAAANVKLEVVTIDTDTTVR